MTSLKGTSVRLRLPEPSDVDALYLWENNPDNWRVSDTLFPYSKKQLEEFVAHNRDIFQSRQLRFMIEELATGNLLGCVDIFDFEPYHSRAGVGIIIADEHARRKGYASDALSVLIDYSFEVLMINQLWCHIGENNEPSLKLFTSKGFEIGGVKKKWMRSSYDFIDVYFLQLLNHNQSD